MPPTPSLPAPAAVPAPVGTSLAVLAPYLPYKLEMTWAEVPYDFLGQGYYLRSLSDFEGHEVAISHRASPESFDWYSYESVLPVLRPFTALCDPLPDGSVPAVEVAKLVTSRQDWRVSDWGKGYVLLDNTINCGYECIIKNLDQHGQTWGWEILVRTAVLKDKVDMIRVLAAYDYLRSKHFAVNLQPAQYIAASPPLPGPLGKGGGA